MGIVSDFFTFAYWQAPLVTLTVFAAIWWWGVKLPEKKRRR